MFTVFTPNSTSSDGWENKGTLGANLPAVAKCSTVMNKGNGNFCLIAMDGGDKPTHSIPVSKKASKGDSCRSLTLYASPKGELVLGTTGGDIDWE